MRAVLVTGFEAFGSTPVNPAQLVAEKLDGLRLHGTPVVGLTIANSFDTCREVVIDAIERERPETVVMLGEYGGRATITAERVAINLDDSARYRLADNAGVIRNGEPIVPEGPAALFTTLPARAMVRAMRAAGVPADISDTAGTNVCNHLLYGVLERLRAMGSTVRAGWLHLPHLPEIAARDEHLGAPSMSLQTATAGVKAAIDAALEHREDIADTIISRWQI